jgi:hypothetical protein
MGNGVPTDPKDPPIDQVKVGSVAISIYYSPVTVKVKLRAAENGEGQPPVAPEAGVKTYDSYLIPHYEGKERVINRRNTIEESRKYAKEVATRLSRDGARAEFLTDMDRRIYTLAQAAVRPMDMEVDEVCRRYAELQRRLKEGTLKRPSISKTTTASVSGTEPPRRIFTANTSNTSKSAALAITTCATPNERLPKGATPKLPLL